MALGGGTFLTQNKILPGSYINFISLSKASATLSDRGTAAMAFELDWGVDNEVFEVTNADFQKNSAKIFGYDYTHEKLKGLRDLFLNVKTLYAYKLNSGGKKAKTENGLATAKYSGTRGNNLKVIIEENVDDDTKFDVKTVFDKDIYEVQTVSSAAELKNNDFIVWDKESDLEKAAAVPLEGGTNGESGNSQYQKFLDKIEAFSFNALGVVSEESTVNNLFASFCKRLRDEQGAKFQVVAYDTPADYEGVVNVKNEADDEFGKASLVYWVTGIIAACEVNKSNLNKKYNGEFEIDADYTQSELEKAIKAGEFVLHQVGNELRVLQDINSLVTVSDTKSDVFKDNQTIRVVDQIANDIAVLFNTRYLGVVPNDESGRVSLWADIVKHHEQLQDVRAIENFDSEDVTVMQGDNKKSVVVNDIVTVVNAMAQLYMTCVVA